MPPIETPTRRWARTDATQQRILDAAIEEFGARGFTAATMADIVAASGASIGSIYHHFGGKKELFLAIFERMAADTDRRISEAVAQTPTVDPPRAFEVNVRAYLQATWANRRVVLLLASGDVPAGFDRIRRKRMLTNFRRWISVLDLDTSPRGQLISRLLIDVMAESALMVAMCVEASDAEPIIEATIDCIDRLTR
ncbi:MAG: TetR/AcrR family transcriptional regulator [Mycobacteriaceae bacterium]|nr:TetR/AcrR family transcriptional regulator [Mycobacteriaceae bacterium]